MAAFTSVVAVKETPAPAGGDGLKTVMGTAVGPNTYANAGSTIDLSSIFSGKVYMILANADVADARLSFVPGTLYAAATCKLFVDDNNGTEIGTVDLSTTLAVVEWIAWGTDA